MRRKIGETPKRSVTKTIRGKQTKSKSTYNDTTYSPSNRNSQATIRGPPMVPETTP